MRKERVLDSLFPELRQQILATTLLAPGRRWYMSELAAQIRVTPSSIQREVTSLSRAGILKRTKDGQRTYFEADVTSPIYPELHGLFKKTHGVVEALKGSLSAFEEKIDAAFIYGSYADSTSLTNASDIDLMVIGAVTPFELSRALSELEKNISREINPMVYSLNEYNEKLLAGNHFLTSVLGKGRLPILGDMSVLAATSI